MASKVSSGDATTSPNDIKGYMKTNTRRIIIKENNQQGGVNGGAAVPSIAREIVIEEAGLPLNDSIEGSQRCRSSSPTMLIIGKSSGTPTSKSCSASTSPSTLSPVLVNKTVRSSSPRSCSPRPRSPSPDERNITLDPQPQSRTILSKTAKPSPTNQRSKMSQNRITLTPTKPVNPASRQKTNKEKDVKEESQGESVDISLEKAKSNLVAAGVPRVHKVIPEESKAKYERFTYLPGVKIIPPSTPIWKVPILQKKNKQVIDDFLQKKELEKRRIEEERRERAREDAIPEWKKPMVKALEKKQQLEKMKAFENAQMEKKELERFNSLPPWRQELTLRKRDQERLDSMPAWQRNLILKKKVANTKDAFEKDGINEPSSIPWSRNNLRKPQVAK